MLCRESGCQESQERQKRALHSSIIITIITVAISVLCLCLRRQSAHAPQVNKNSFIIQSNSGPFRQLQQRTTLLFIITTSQFKLALSRVFSHDIFVTPFLISHPVILCSKLYFLERSYSSRPKQQVYRRISKISTFPRIPLSVSRAQPLSRKLSLKKIIRKRFIARRLQKVCFRQSNGASQQSPQYLTSSIWFEYPRFLELFACRVLFCLYFIPDNIFVTQQASAFSSIAITSHLIYPAPLALLPCPQRKTYAYCYTVRPQEHQHTMVISQWIHPTWTMNSRSSKLRVNLFIKDEKFFWWFYQ